MKFSNTFKVIFGSLAVLLIAVISSVYHIDFNRFLNKFNNKLTNDSTASKKIKVSFINCIDGDTAVFSEDGIINTYINYYCTFFNHIIFNNIINSYRTN